jgi:hypothetical protein
MLLTVSNDSVDIHPQTILPGTQNNYMPPRTRYSC